MAAFVVCGCCGARIPATAADIGRAVVCPTSRRLIMVGPRDLQHQADAPVRARSRWPWVAVVLLLLLLLGFGGYLAWDRFGRPGMGQEIADAASKPEVRPENGSDRDGRNDQTPTSEPRPQPDPTNTFTTTNTTTTTTTNSPVVVPKPDPAKSPPVAITPAIPTTPPVLTAPGGTAGVPAKSNSTPERGPVETNRRDARGLKVYQLPKRIDLRTADELQRELLGIREVSLDTPAQPRTAQHLFEFGVARRLGGQPYPGPAIAAKNRPDLAGLPFRLGPDAVLFKTQAEELNVLSMQLRVKVQSCIPPGQNDPRPDPEKLYEALLAGETGLFRENRWATAEAVPCIQQMLQADGKDIRRMSVELLRGIASPAAVEALVRWAIFDVDADNRAAAVDALKTRDRALVTRLLLVHLRYPWARAAEHAAETLVALDCRDAVPQLAALLLLADPDSTHAPELSGSSIRFRREMVRVNHARNCLMCHPPSPVATDLVRGAIPDPTQPLAPPTTPAYYTGTNRFVHASTTYLRQDFSLVQPVPNPGPWPEYQRYDYLIGVYPAKDGIAAAPPAASPYRGAILFALRELSGRDLGPSTEAWAAVRGTVVPPDDRLIGLAGLYLALVSNPEVVIAFWMSEFGPTFLTLTPAEQNVVLARFRRTYGVNPTRYAVIAYLERVSLSGDPAMRAKALELLAQYRGESSAIDAEPDAEVAVRLLTSKDPQVRASAALAIGQLGNRGRGFFQALLGALSDPDPDVRTAAAIALGDLTAGPDEMFDALAKATADPNPRVRLAAAESLVRLKLLPRSCAKPLAEGLVKKCEWESPAQKASFEKTCIALLDDMKGRTTAAYPVFLGAACGDTPTDLAPAVVVKFLQTTGSPNKEQLGKLVVLLAKPEYRAVAEFHLVDAGDDAIPHLIKALKDENVKQRIAAAEVLGKAGSLKNPATSRTGWRLAMDALAAAKATDTAPEVKTAATEALKNLTASQ